MAEKKVALSPTEQQMSVPALKANKTTVRKSMVKGRKIKG